MNKKVLIGIGVLLLVIVLIFMIRKNRKSKLTEPSSQVQSNQLSNNIYDLMMNTVSRNIIGMDPAEMSSDEQEFYYQYLYEESEDIEMFSYEE